MKSLSQEEAIAILSDMKIDIPVPKAAVTQIKRNVALDMAISALSCSEIPNSSDTISRQAAIDAIKKCRNESDMPDMWYDGMSCALRCIYQLPSAQPERMRGEWIDDGDPFMWVCDVCGYRVKRYNNTRYCPNCGADMRGEQE